ncbi:MAG: alpha/beta hydrolase [Planctomycetes bacterium]|nr:alpha/beta hydrolase [Planctomycetota bacterium]
MIILRIVLLLAVGYAGICVLLYLSQAKLIYFPGPPGVSSPRDIGLAFEEVWLHPAGGGRVHGWFVSAPDARGAVLFCHGNAGTIDDRLDTLRILHKLRLAVLIFDYRGYGRSDGSPSEANTYADAEAAWRHLTERRGIAPDRILLWGRSLGGAVAVELATRHAAAGLVVESSFTSIPDMAAGTFPIPLPFRLLCRHVYDSAAKVARLSCPTLFLHSPEDDIIPWRHGERLFAAAAEPKRLVRIRGDHNHGFLQSGEAYLGPVRAFVSEVLGP